MIFRILDWLVPILFVSLCWAFKYEIDCWRCFRVFIQQIASYRKYILCYQIWGHLLSSAVLTRKWIVYRKQLGIVSGFFLLNIRISSLSGSKMQHFLTFLPLSYGNLFKYMTFIFDHLLWANFSKCARWFSFLFKQRAEY